MIFREFYETIENFLQISSINLIEIAGMIEKVLRISYKIRKFKRKVAKILG